MLVRSHSKLVKEFHESCRPGLIDRLDRARDDEEMPKDFYQGLVRMLREYPALAVASAHHLPVASAHHLDISLAVTLFWTRKAPIVEVTKYARIRIGRQRIGPEVPASALRIKPGRGGWPRMYIVEEETKNAA